MSWINHHLKETNKNYFQHMFYAFTVIARLLWITFCCIIHAFVPFLFSHTTSNMVAKLHQEFTTFLYKK